MKYTLDAENKKLGRIATEIAVLLMGKNKIDFARNAMPDDQVEVKNASKLSITDKKAESTVYKTFSGYPGGLTEKPLSKLAASKGFSEALRRTVSGMLPKNKLRARMLKNLNITE
ncbi:MAG: 50S ribosomal protein L13 [Candidatus Zambryskibacteria bacterium]|nr:50S ribosomal protein L13 [Candidatus Zambryskibacteria bacterium]